MPKTIATTLFALKIGLITPILPLLTPVAIAQQQPIPFGGNVDIIRLMSKGMDHLQAGKLDEAIRDFEQVLKILPASIAPTDEFTVLALTANAHTLAGTNDRATRYYEKALAIARQHQLRQFESMALGDLAQNYGLIGQYEKALALALQGLQMNRELNDRKSETATLNDLGLLYAALGNDRKAEEYYRTGLDIAQQIKFAKMAVIISTNLSGLLRRAGDYQQALQFQQQALAGYRSLGDNTGVMGSLNNLGAIKASLKEYDAALQIHQESYQMARKSQAPRVEVDALSSMAKVHNAKENWPQAMDLGQQAANIATRINYQPRLGTILTDLSETYLRSGKLAEAEATIQKAVPILDNLRLGLNDSNKITLIESQAKIYRLLQEVLIRQNRPEAALEAAERGRARAFVELLASRIRSKTNTDIQAIAQAPQIQKIRQIAQAQNATMVEYSLANDKLLYIWVIKPNGEVVFRSTPIDSIKSLNKLVIQSRSHIGVRSQATTTVAEPTASATNHLRALHQLLIEPIAQDLPTDPNQPVIFLPQGALFLVPFAGLPDAKGKYLIERHTLSISPSIQTLELTQAIAKRPQSRNSLVVVGDPQMPEYNGSQLAPLPGSRQEAIEIAKIFKTQPLLGEQATKSTVLQQMLSARMIHLATHGLLDKVNGEIPGAIALAPSSSDNGLLSSSEIFDLKLQADLVVLSACDTGRGDITGDGVIGLSRSFIAAGVPSIVVSLWAVNDSSTAAFMSHFYTNLQTNPNQSQALRQAMLKTMQEYPNPSDWAAFTLIGETK
jgi:CHAT domain-containing protein